MMKLATVTCINPNCKTIYEAAMDEGEFHATCVVCGQRNRVAGNAMGKEITGRCTECGGPLDEWHMWARDGNFCCRYPKGKK